MSVLIRGFEKPDHCLRCPMKGIDDECVLQGVEVCDEYEDWKQQMANCPLVPVPPHGDLIDSNDYRDEFMNGVYDLCADDPDNNRANAIIDLFDNAPTIIQADKEV